MNVTKKEKRFYGTIEQFNDFIKRYDFRRVAKRFDDDSTYIDKNATILRVYVSSTYEYPLYWRVIMYDRTTSVTNDGYKLVSIGKKRYTMHQIMAWTFLNNPNPNIYTDVDHIDGDKLNNKLDNLRWTTRKENMRSYFEAKKLRDNSDEKGLNNFIKRLQSQSYEQYIPYQNTDSSMPHEVQEVFDWAKNENDKIKVKLYQDIEKIQQAANRAEKALLLDAIRNLNYNEEGEF